MQKAKRIGAVGIYAAMQINLAAGSGNSREIAIFLSPILEPKKA
jgi:hypothetical protein